MKNVHEGTRLMRVMVGLTLGLVVGCGCAIDDVPREQQSSSAGKPSEWVRIDPQAVRVVDVLSGDTLIVDLGGNETKIGIIGIQSPSVGSPDPATRCFAELATTNLKALEAGAGVRLFDDASQERLDDSGRQLEHVRLLATGSQAGSEQLRAGYAQTVHRGGYHNEELTYNSVEEQAKQGRAGMWGAQVCR
jgi:micrococcal nuclease